MSTFSIYPGFRSHSGQGVKQVSYILVPVRCNRGWNPDPGKNPDRKGPDPYLTCVKGSPRLSMNQYLFIMRDIA